MGHFLVMCLWWLSITRKSNNAILAFRVHVFLQLRALLAHWHTELKVFFYFSNLVPKLMWPTNRFFFQYFINPPKPSNWDWSVKAFFVSWLSGSNTHPMVLWEFGSTVVSGSMTTANSITINRRVEMVWTNCLRHAKAVRKLEGSNSTTCYFQPRVWKCPVRESHLLHLWRLQAVFNWGHSCYLAYRRDLIAA